MTNDFYENVSDEDLNEMLREARGRFEDSKDFSKLEEAIIIAEVLANRGGPVGSAGMLYLGDVYGGYYTEYHTGSDKLWDFEQPEPSNQYYDVNKCLYWYNEAALEGGSYAAYRLGEIHYYGWGTPRNFKRAYKYFQIAIDRIDESRLLSNDWLLGSAYFYLADMICYEAGIKTDYAKAKMYCEYGIDLGHTSCANLIGIMYIEGWGVAKDYAKAKAYFEAAYEDENPYAAWNLAELYRKGLGVEPDEVEAKAWYQRAADRGHVPSQEYLK